MLSSSACHFCSTFNIPFSRSASYDDNLAFFKEVLAELHRCALHTHDNTYCCCCHGKSGVNVETRSRVGRGREQGTLKGDNSTAEVAVPAFQGVSHYACPLCFTLHCLMTRQQVERLTARNEIRGHYVLAWPVFGAICSAIAVSVDLLFVRRAFKIVVFVIDQVDAFVRACKQTLLYNVLDALTSSQVQVGQASRSSNATQPHALDRLQFCSTMRRSADTSITWCTSPGHGDL